MLDKKRKIVLVLSLAVVLFFVTGSYFGSRLDTEAPFRPLSIFGEVISHVNKDYVEDVDEAKAMRGAITGFLEGLDPACSYLNKDEASQYQKLAAQIEASPVSLTKRFGYGYVLGVEPGSRAEAAGLKRGDIIRAVNRQSARDLGLFQIQELLSGAPPVECTIVRDGWRADPVKVTLSEPETGRRPPAVVSQSDGATIIRVHRIRQGLSHVVRQALVSARREQRDGGPVALVLDLRGCGGGDYPEALRVASTLVKTGVVAVRREHSDKSREYKADGVSFVHAARGGVITDEHTWGAAELLAASLRAAGVAKTFGLTTYGTVREQHLFLFSDGSGVLLSAYEWAAPDGVLITGKGLKPDVEVKDDGKQKTDAALAAAVTYAVGS